MEKYRLNADLNLCYKERGTLYLFLNQLVLMVQRTEISIEINDNKKFKVQRTAILSNCLFSYVRAQ